MSLRINIDYENNAIKRTLESLEFDDEFNITNREHEDELYAADYGVRVSSAVKDWAELPVNPTWPTDANFRCPINVTLRRHIDDIVDTVSRHKVTLIQSPTGAGKSIITAAVVVKVMMKAFGNGSCGLFTPDLGLKVIHLTPTADQTHQNRNYIHESMRQSCRLVVGSYSSGISLLGRENNSLSKGVTNYLFSTFFFGHQVLEGNTMIHFVIIDEIHDLTSKVMHLLQIAKEKIKHGFVFRLILLSATLPDNIKERLRDIFHQDEINMGILDVGHTPHPISIVSAASNTISRRALQKTDPDGVNPSPTDQFLYDHENLPDTIPFQRHKTPNMNHLRDRLVHMTMEALKPSFDATIDDLNSDPRGVLAFLPGNSDVVLARKDFQELLKGEKERRLVPDPLNGLHLIDVYKVSGQDRNDLAILNKLKMPQIRTVFSSPLLSTGVTVIGINIIVDSGVMKIQACHNIHGIESLQAIWQDKNMRKQRQGRVGRTGNGIVFECYSKKRATLMEKDDWTYLNFTSRCSNTDLAHILKYWKKLMYVDVDVVQVLILESGLMGCFHEDLRSPYHSHLPYLDPVTEAICKYFTYDSMDWGLFLIICKAFGILLPGLVFLASVRCQHSGTRRPSNDPNRQGRDGTTPCNYWPGFSGSGRSSVPYSDIMIYMEVLVNLIVNSPGRLLSVDDWIVKLDAVCTEFTHSEGVTEVYRSVWACISALRSLRLVDSVGDAFSRHNSGMEMYRVGLNNEFHILRFTTSAARLMRIALGMAFGHRPLHLAHPSKHRQSNYRYVLAGGYKGNNCDVLVQGERSRAAMDSGPPMKLAVYPTLFDHDNGEGFITGLIHQMSYQEFLLFGNAYASHVDKQDLDNGRLTIHTNNGPITFEFKCDYLQRGIYHWRRVLKMLPKARLDHHYDHIQAITAYCRSLWMDRNTLLATRDIEPLFVPHTIDSYEYFIRQ